MGTTARMHHGGHGADSAANERFKAHFATLLWESVAVAVVLHFLLISLWPSMSVADVSYTARELAAVELPPEIEVPAAPAAIPRPATPVVSDVGIDEEITIAPTTFDANPIESLPMPPAMSEATELSVAPTLTPYTIAPELKNRSEVQQALLRFYPPLLKDSGIGGSVLLWFFIDEDGNVVRTQLMRSSGYEALDEAAARVASVMRFSPAYNRDRKVPVWVQLPVLFEVM